MISCSVNPSFTNFDITFDMSFIPAFMLVRWMSVLMVLGFNPCSSAGTAIL